MTSLAYAAPEVQAGVSPTVLSDQYSFCASVHTALQRVVGERVPKRVAAILERGMSALLRRTFGSFKFVA
jgi:hypothetical protein